VKDYSFRDFLDESEQRTVERLSTIEDQRQLNEYWAQKVRELATEMPGPGKFWEDYHKALEEDKDANRD